MMAERHKSAFGPAYGPSPYTTHACLARQSIASTRRSMPPSDIYAIVHPLLGYAAGIPSGSLIGPFPGPQEDHRTSTNEIR